MSDTVLVTCMFNRTYSTKLGGRNRENMYKESLPCIAKMNVDIICFTSPEEYEDTCQFFKNNGLSNVKVLKYDLLQQDYHADIMRIKDSAPQTYYGELFWQTRCAHIMWGKTRMLQHVISRYQYKQVFWIDAGLSSSSLMWSEYFPKIKSDKYYYSEGIFTDRFLQSLEKSGETRILALLHNFPNNAPIAAEYNLTPYEDGAAMIGGLFGGPSKHMEWFCAYFEDYVNKVLARNFLISEESIYSGIYNDFKDRFNVMRFDTFYNEDWEGVYNPNHVSFASILKKFMDGNI